MSKAARRVPLKPAAPRAKAADMERWIGDRMGADPEASPPPAANAPGKPPAAMKRLTFDIPADLHKRLRIGAARREQAIADTLRELIAREFPASLLD